MALLLGEHLVVGELAVEVLPDVVDPARVPLLARELRVQAAVLFHEVVAAAQVQPGPGPHGRGDAFAAALADLVKPKRKHN